MFQANLPQNQYNKIVKGATIDTTRFAIGPIHMCFKFLFLFFKNVIFIDT